MNSMTFLWIFYFIVIYLKFFHNGPYHAWILP